MTKIKPVLHRVLVKPDEVEKRTQSGIIIQYDKREEKAVETGTVISIGSTAYQEFGTTAESEGIKPGSKVTFAKYAGKEILDGEDKYLILNDEDIVGVYND